MPQRPTVPGTASLGEHPNHAFSFDDSNNLGHSSRVGHEFASRDGTEQIHQDMEQLCTKHTVRGDKLYIMRQIDTDKKGIPEIDMISNYQIGGLEIIHTYIID